MPDTKFYAPPIRSDTGKLLAESLNRRALTEIADWCKASALILEDSPSPAAQTDAETFAELGAKIAKLAEYAS